MEVTDKFHTSAVLSAAKVLCVLNGQDAALRVGHRDVYEKIPTNTTVIESK
jgi:hypothetical protein